jgi:hypothetical protein
MQNVDTWEQYAEMIDRGELPLGRAYRHTADERLIRETILQLKRGSIRPGLLRAEVRRGRRDRFAPAWQSIKADGYPGRGFRGPHRADARGLLRVDVLLHRFFLDKHRNVRYT